MHALTFPNSFPFIVRKYCNHMQVSFGKSYMPGCFEGLTSDLGWTHQNTEIKHTHYDYASLYTQLLQ